MSRVLIRGLNFFGFWEWREAEEYHKEALLSFLNCPRSPVNRPLYVSIHENNQEIEDYNSYAYIARYNNNYLYINKNNNKFELKYIND